MRLGKEPYKGLVGIVSSRHKRPGTVPVLLARLEKLVTHRAVGRILRKVLPQQWGIITPRMSTALEPPNKS